MWPGELRGTGGLGRSPDVLVCPEWFLSVPEHGDSLLSPGCVLHGEKAAGGVGMVEAEPQIYSESRGPGSGRRLVQGTGVPLGAVG